MKIKVEYSLGRTMNLGDFESARVNVSAGVEMEADHPTAVLEKAYAKLKSFVVEKVEEEEERWKL